MNRNEFINSVLPSHTRKDYPSPMFPKKEDLENALKIKGINVILNEPLKGGFFSKVYSAKLDDSPVVVKCIDSVTPFDPTEFFIDRKQYDTDIKVLELFSQSLKIKVPKVHLKIPEVNTVIMEDLREDGYVLLNDLILGKKLDINSSGKIGEALANLIKESRNFEEFETNESAEQSIYERGLELRLAYPNSQKEYLYLEKEFVGNNKYFCWPDNHPKNIFVKENGDCSFIDFGRSVWADQRYMLPNFLAHIVIYSLAGYIPKGLAENYVRECVDSYKKIEPIDEDIFCQYLAMEVLHRANGKWIAGVDKKEQKLALQQFGLTVFDEKVKTINQLVNLLNK